MCCATNRTQVPESNFADGDTQDRCLPNGLCQNIARKGSQMVYSYLRDACSSSNWEGCLQGVCGVSAAGSMPH